MRFTNMCLTIPKKVVAVEDGVVTLETMDGSRQVVKSIVDLEIGDYAATQQNVVVQKINKEDAEEVLKILNETKENIV